MVPVRLVGVGGRKLCHELGYGHPWWLRAKVGGSAKREQAPAGSSAVALERAVQSVPRLTVLAPHLSSARLALLSMASAVATPESSIADVVKTPLPPVQYGTHLRAQLVDSKPTHTVAPDTGGSPTRTSGVELGRVGQLNLTGHVHRPRDERLLELEAQLVGLGLGRRPDAIAIGCGARQRQPRRLPRRGEAILGPINVVRGCHVGDERRPHNGSQRAG
eukprot:1084628-Prymnesium_polylepis.2